MQYTISFILAGIFLFSKLSAEEIAQRSEEIPSKTAHQQEHIVQWARDHLPQTGVLTEEERGFVYLKVDDGYINELFPMIHHSGYSKPPYFRRSNAPGAHISVFYVNERNQTGAIKEIGQKYSFQITGFASVPPKTREYIVLQIESPELEQLRKKYGVSPLLQGHEFHITIAKKNRRYD